MITYNSINIGLPDIDRHAVTSWISQVASGYGKKVGDINYIFVDDGEILRINRQFINHDYYTDHIGFDYTQGNILSGDTYISLDTVRTNAQLFHKTYQDELHRVMIHSILHLCGLKDKTPEERLAMEKAEDAALALLS
ncbi:MAG: rRNA maturation RNase YbeY [Bacteroidaceae bacterium]|nr:rRNA maturation RNase YbeY [Bacteroidaceae bacterium]